MAAPLHRQFRQDDFNELSFESKKNLSKLGMHWKWILATGIIYLMLGVITMLTPITTTMGLTFVIATVLIIAGTMNLIHAIRLYKYHGFGIRFVFAIIPLVAGALFFRYPGEGLLTLSLILSFYFFMSAASQFSGAISMRPMNGWGWGIVGAVASFALGVALLLTFPFSALWIPGFIFSIDLIMAGSAMVGLSYCLRDFHDENRSLVNMTLDGPGFIQHSYRPRSKHKSRNHLRPTQQNI